MKKTIHSAKSKMSKEQGKRFCEAKVSYEKLLQEVLPFVPRLQSKEASTAGTWQNTSSLLLY